VHRLRVSEELEYLLIVVGLFLVPRVLQRFKIPTAITCVALGAVLGVGFGLFHDDSVVPLLATLGIVALFLLAGLEVDVAEMRRGSRVTLGYLVIQLLLLAGGSWLSMQLFELEWRPALLLTLAILTPSTGFILDSLAAFGLTEQQRFWVKTKAIASELVALAALFLVVQSADVLGLGIASAVLAAMIIVLPFAFHLFAKRVLPFAPKSEFTFLLMLALLCAFITRKLGVYYLVGAFVVGVTAVRLSKRIPEFASERLLIGIELFASFFIPFYFFKAGLHLRGELFSLKGVTIGLAFVAIAVPLRVGTVAAFRSLALEEKMKDSARVGLSLVPTLVFTLVLADILHERYALPDYLFGALTVFALVNTAIPGIVLRAAPPDFVAPDAPRSTMAPHAAVAAGSKTSSGTLVMTAPGAGRPRTPV
jgi:Kef-type K+ transport system membrane component KefB